MTRPSAFEQIRRENEQRTRELLERKKAEAAARGKEPFDYERLHAMVAQGSLGHMNPDEERTFLERLYYVEHADVLTLEALPMNWPSSERGGAERAADKRRLRG